VKRSALAVRSATIPPRPRPEPQYVVRAAAPEPTPEEKRGLLGSLKSLIRKE
jgi:hypothetical protein